MHIILIEWSCNLNEKHKVMHSVNTVKRRYWNKVYAPLKEFIDEFQKMQAKS